MNYTRILLKLFVVLFPLLGFSHPGVGIVKDSKGNIYYTDLQHVWKISKGKKTIAVANVHTHELYVDQNDNLFGEGGYYNSGTEKFFHYLWVLRPGERMDTVIGMREEYVKPDFSLARDRRGTEFYLKRFMSPFTDTNHIYRRPPGGAEAVLATGNFKRVNWLHPQDDGSVLFASGSVIYRIDSLGNIALITDRIKNSHNGKPNEEALVWGIWQDQAKNVYAAVLSDGVIKKIEPSGAITTIFTSAENWFPLHGVFDSDNVLWVMESSDKNEIRVVSHKANSNSAINATQNSKQWPLVIAGSVLLVAGLVFIKYKK